MRDITRKPFLPFIFLFLTSMLLMSCSSIELSYSEVQSRQFDSQILKLADEGNQKGDALIELDEGIKRLLDIEFSNAGNNMGVAMRRAGDYQLAEYSFRKSVFLNPINSPFLGVENTWSRFLTKISPEGFVPRH